MAPLAGRPPFATDEPDSFYQSPQHPQRRIRQPAPVDPNARTSGYDVYDNYFGNEPTTNRQSGMGAVGLGFLNADSDDSEDEDYDRKVAMPSPTKSGADPLPSKHKALAEATGARVRTPSPPPQYIAAPRPGYAAPIASLNLARPEATAAPGARQNPAMMVNTAPARPMYASPSPTVPGTPHTLGPPISPITPAFARPRPPKSGDVTFVDAPRGEPIPRGGGEDTLLPKRGDAGDDFWRRFSMIAKEEKSSPKQSAWLRKTQNGSNRLATWVWIVGLVLLLAAGGGIGLGWYFSHKAPDHQQPTAIGGGASQAAPSSSATSLKSVGAGKPTLATSLHVSPTNTVARREAEPEAFPMVTSVPLVHRQAFRRR